MRKVKYILIALFLIGGVIACNESKVEAGSSVKALVARYDYLVLSKIDLVNAPDGHQYVVLFGGDYGGIVHAQGCNNSSHTVSN